MIRYATIFLVLLLNGCGIPVAVVTGALGVAAGALRLDNTILDAWLAARSEARVPATPTPVPGPTPLARAVICGAVPVKSMCSSPPSAHNIYFSITRSELTSQ